MLLNHPDISGQSDSSLLCLGRPALSELQAQIFNWVPFTSPADHSTTRAVLTGVILGPLATVVLMNVPFTLIYHPLVTALGCVAISEFRQ